jgi:hypothetical protein
MINLSKTKLMPHQVVGVSRMKGHKGFALLMEQGTGKSLTFLEEALQEYAAGEIELVFILAPNGVHENWILDQIPSHIPETIEARAAYYCSDMNKREKQQMDWTLRARRDGEVPPLRFVGMSYDSLLTDKGWDLAIKGGALTQHAADRRRIAADQVPGCDTHQARAQPAKVREDPPHRNGHRRHQQPGGRLQPVPLPGRRGRARHPGHRLAAGLSRRVLRTPHTRGTDCCAISWTEWSAPVVTLTPTPSARKSWSVRRS